MQARRMRSEAGQTCSECGKELGNVFCRMFCPYCGAEIDTLMLEPGQEVEIPLLVLADPLPEAG